MYLFGRGEKPCLETQLRQRVAFYKSIPDPFPFAPVLLVGIVPAYIFRVYIYHTLSVPGLGAAHRTFHLSGSGTRDKRTAFLACLAWFLQNNMKKARPFLIRLHGGKSCGWVVGLLLRVFITSSISALPTAVCCGILPLVTVYYSQGINASKK